MSFEIIVSITCDGAGCSERVTADTEHRSGWTKSAVFNARALAENAGWMTTQRGRFNANAHYCPKCADSNAAAPIPRRKNPAPVIPKSWFKTPEAQS